MAGEHAHTGSMSCDCGPCGPQPYRCSCERDCWVGAPENYATCMEACGADGCDFPHVPGWPSLGYRCEAPVPEYDTCEAGCAAVLDPALTACADALEVCLDGASTADEVSGCLRLECLCRSEAYQDYHSCELGCQGTYVYPAALACAEADVQGDKTCCATELGDCYQPCETQLVTDATPVEAAYNTCAQTTAAVHPYYIYDEEFGAGCIEGPDLNLTECTRQRVASMIPLLAENRICRAKCERAEIGRETVEDRKYKECGGRYHECGETCAADFDVTVGDAVDAAYLCILPCLELGEPDDQEACMRPCYTVYRAAYAEAAVLLAQCAMGCCKQEYDHARNGHARAECRLSCYEQRLRDEVSCYDAYAQCMEDASGTEEAAACHADWCSCDADWRDTYELCLTECSQTGDCPDCFDDVVNRLEGWLDEPCGERDPTGMPPSGVGRYPEGCA